MKCQQCEQEPIWVLTTEDTESNELIASERLCARCLMTAMSILAYTIDRRSISIYPIKETYGVQELPPIIGEKEVKQSVPPEHWDRLSDAEDKYDEGDHH